GVDLRGMTHAELDIPGELPVLPLREFVVFPYMVLPLFVARESSIAAVEDSLAADRLVLLVAQRNAEVEEPEPDDLHRVGTVAMVMRSMRLPDGRLKVLLQGLSKASIESFVENEATRWASVEPIAPDEEPDWCVEAEAAIRNVRMRVEELLPLKNLPPEVLSITANVHEPGRLADLVASNLKLRLAEAQEILEVQDPLVRLRRIEALLKRELDVTTMQAEIQSQAKEEMSRSQREHFLREQLRAIQVELGDADPRIEEVAEYRDKIEDAQLDGEAYEEAQRQLRRLERMHPESPEAQVVRSYLEWLAELPWSRVSPDRLDLPRAREILDEDHAHLSGIKDRILEFLGVRKLRHDSRGPILCLAGPPGVGKTSLGRSIARAMGREFVRVSIGGTRDEAEIRGHRRTYVGALPGRVIQGIKQAGTRNPVFMLDEIDKLGSDFRGDPSSALLEVLDPEQNQRYSDHYLNVPFDLSEVFFIATANTLEAIPGPLRDRMEVIRLAGYTPEEKVEIARSFLIPRQIDAAGLPEDRVRWSDPAIRHTVTDYTAEAGVRNLDRQIAAVCRKAARRAAEGCEKPLRVNRNTLKQLLGPPRRLQEEVLAEPEIGQANGLAWTEAGGEMLRVEVADTAGRGLTLTGQLGDVMKESAQAALTFSRWKLAEFGSEHAALLRRQLHVHVPAGAIPKDGPSAGVTMAVALLSLATGIPVRHDVAMTGEVTLRGRVLPVGGVREKALAALRTGIHTVILPAANMVDLRDIPTELARRIEFVPVEHMDDVLDVVLLRPLGPRRPRSTQKRPAARASVANAKKR
ncbi:MAG: endopeptidase La, partial [Myxococcales bacterium]|nr:endopeptidase La [Myxococcales bacterium]